MNKPSLPFWTLLILMFVAQLSIPSSMILGQKKVQREGTTFLFELDAIDPTDPFRGSYIILDPKEDNIELSSDTYDKDLDSYAIFNTNEQGYAELAGLITDRPQHSDYLKVVTYTNFTNRDKIYSVRVKYPFDRYYVNEDIAERAADLIREVLNDSSQTTYAEVKILDGRHSLIDIKVNGQSLNQILNR